MAIGYTEVMLQRLCMLMIFRHPSQSLFLIIEIIKIEHTQKKYDE